MYSVLCFLSQNQAYVNILKTIKDLGKIFSSGAQNSLRFELKMMGWWKEKSLGSAPLGIRKSFSSKLLFSAEFGKKSITMTFTLKIGSLST